MDSGFSVGKEIKKARTEGFILNCRMPLGYGSGIPVLMVKNGFLCMKVPYLRYQITGKVDETLVYPIRYLVTFELPEMKVIGFEDLKYSEEFSQLDFDRPVGKFRHEELKKYDRKQYFAMKDELYSLYDKLIGTLIGGTVFPAEDEIRIREIIGVILEPSLLPMYEYMDTDFYEKFIARG